MWNQSNGGAAIKNVALTFVSEFTAGSVTYDAVKTTTPVVDRAGYNSAQFVIGAKTTIATSKALNCIVNILDSANNSDWSAAEQLVSASIVSGLTTANIDTYPIDIDLAGYERYIKFEITPDLTATGTDTAWVTTSLNLCGAEALPVA